MGFAAWQYTDPVAGIGELGARLYHTLLQTLLTLEMYGEPPPGRVAALLLSPPGGGAGSSAAHAAAGSGALGGPGVSRARAVSDVSEDDEWEGEGADMLDEWECAEVRAGEDSSSYYARLGLEP